ncbi:MAG TPA: sigma-70 family RNA polymerase sigma factor [Myxococcota bacterium]|nr:sigma-70 family RNA polymerase sigma factor [Myxococcota bacterium]
MEEEDDSLLRRMAGGDRSAMGLLYDRQAPLLLGVTIKMGFDREAAEDLVHDLFLEVWRAAADYDPHRGSVRTWLLVRLRSRALDRRRSGHARHMVAVADLQTVDRPQAVEEDPVLSSDRAAVVRELDQLPPEQRQVLELAYFEGLSAAEIAGRVGIPTGTVKSRLASGLGKLRQALGGGP